VRENEYQARLLKKLERMFKGCVILKNDANVIQGFPDLLILYRDKWAVLEVKASADSAIQPNQPYYIDLLGTMSFAAFIYPENEDEVLYALQRSFKSHRNARAIQRV
jgi:hypothetical protein